MSIKGGSWRSRLPRLCRVCGETAPEKFEICRHATLCTRCWRIRWQDSVTRSRIKVRLRQKAQVLTHYGPKGQMRCSWAGCTVTDPDMLVIDHIQDNGADEKRQKIGRKGHELYRRLIREGYPEGYQTLCCNHNHKKEILRSRNNRKPTTASKENDNYTTSGCAIHNACCLSSDSL